MNLSIFEQARICSALALKNIQASLMFLARLSIFLEGVKFTACPIFICCKIIVPLWIETRTAYKWVINVRTRLYAVCLSSSTFSSVVHFRCRLHFRVQTLKGERFRGEYSPQEEDSDRNGLPPRPFNFQGPMYYLRRRAKERSE